jgi:hypothetical protein
MTLNVKWMMRLCYLALNLAMRLLPTCKLFKCSKKNQRKAGFFWAPN